MTLEDKIDINIGFWTKIKVTKIVSAYVSDDVKYTGFDSFGLVIIEFKNTDYGCNRMDLYEEDYYGILSLIREEKINKILENK